MSNFKFPPVPPPPPRATADPASNHRGGNSRGRGRGRGYNNYRRRAFRDGGSFYVQQDDRSPSTDQHSNFAYSQQNFTTSQAHANVSNISYHHLAGVPVGSHVNPAFFRNNQLQQGSGQQIFNVRDDGSGLHPPRTAAGQKRKLEALREPQQDRRKPGPPTAPSVPSFGAGLLPSHQNNRASASQQIKKKQPRKRLTNTLGLTPASLIPQYSSSEAEAEASGDDIDEEAMHAELGTTLTFEHNGTVMSLNTAADLNAWKKERRKAWPTRQRLAEKAKEKQRVGERRTRMIANAVAALSKPKVRNFEGRAVNGREPVRKTIDPSKATEKIHDEPIDSSSRIDAEADGPVDGSAMMESNAEQPYETSDSGSDISSDSSSEDSSEESSDEDGPPEALPSNRPPPQGNLPQIRRMSNKSQPSRQRNAANSDRSEESSQRPDIYRMLVEKEEEGIDELGLQVIKFLGDFGFFDK